MSTADRTPLIVPTGVLCALLDVTPPALQAWLKEGCPKLARGRFDLGAVLRWRRARDIAVARSRTDTLAGERRRLIAEQVRGHQIQNCARASELLPAADVAADMMAVLGIISRELEALPAAAAPGLVSQTDPAVIIGRLRAACRQARRRAGDAIDVYAQSLDEQHGD